MEAEPGATEALPGATELAMEQLKLTVEPWRLNVESWRLTLESWSPHCGSGGLPLDYGNPFEAHHGALEALLKPLRFTLEP